MLTIPKEAWTGILETHEAFSKLEPSQRCDLYILVKTTNGRLGKVDVSGLGMLEQGDSVVLFAATSVHLFDSNGLLHWRVVGRDLKEANVKGRLDAPNRNLDGTWWPATPQAAVQSEKLRSATRALVEEVLADAVPALVGMPGASLGR